MTDFRKIVFGKTDARAESAECPNLAIDGYFPLDNIDEKILELNPFLILGSKGSGKTALSEFLKLTADGGHQDITFSGTRPRGNKRVRNAEIAFINEYGRRGQPARPFIGKAMTANEEKIADAGADIQSDDGSLLHLAVGQR